MKRNSLFLAVLVLLANMSFSQYYMLPRDTNYYWKQRSACSGYNYQIRYSKDTLLNGLVYKKYSQFGGNSGNSPCASFIKHGYLREDSFYQQVFILDHVFKDRPLYDFSRTAGDSIYSYDKMTSSPMMLRIDSSGTMLLGDGTYRRYQWVSGSGYNYRNLFIEGVGSFYGGLYGLNMKSLSNFNITEELACFGRINPFSILQYGSAPSYCYITNTGIDKASSEENGLRIFPLPVKDILHIDSDETEQFSQFSLYDIFGKKLLDLKEFTLEHSVDLSPFPAGMYFLNVEEQTGKKVYKILKE